MRALVTGGAGFIGRHLVGWLLGRGCDVLALDNLSNGSAGNLEEFGGEAGFAGLLEGDVCDEDIWASLTGQRFDSIYHLAAAINVQDSIDDPARTFNSDVVGTFRALEFARAQNSRFIYISTCLVYAPAVDGTPITERYPTRPASPYAAAKLAGENLTLSYYHAYGLHALILRPFNTYGPYQRTDGEGGVVVTFLNQYLKGEPLVVFGDGRQTRDLLYVDDCADLIGRAGESNAAGSVINGGLGQEIEIRNLARKIAGNEDGVKFAAHPHSQAEVWRLVCDNAKAAQLLDWRPTTSLDEGIARTRAWMEERIG
ncbi:MAG: GDP-mannose 4,6-dehydratase [Candidatus Zixiibacteriota bacterium]|jgi:nucleoside-diphosphate-sugar epimerase